MDARIASEPRRPLSMFLGVPRDLPSHREPLLRYACERLCVAMTGDKPEKR
jgi:hypothetical protein